MKNAYNTQYINDNEEINNIKLNDLFSSLHHIRMISRFTFMIIRKLINNKRKKNEYLITKNLCQIRRKREKKSTSSKNDL